MKVNALKRILPYAVISALLCAMVAVAFLPVFDKAPPVAARSAVLDPDAVTALNNCTAFIESHDFTAKMSGKVKARVFGIPYTQKMCGARGVENGEYFETDETSSVFVSTGLKKRVRGGKCSVAEGKKNKDGKFDYAEPAELDYAEFVAKFGKPASGLTHYELAQAVSSAARVDADTYRYELDPNRAAIFYKNAIKTAVGAKSYPKYSAISFTLTVNGDRPTSIAASERFSIDKFGGTDCEVEYTETFEFD